MLQPVSTLQVKVSGSVSTPLVQIEWMTARLTFVAPWKGHLVNAQGAEGIFKQPQQSLQVENEQLFWSQFPPLIYCNIMRKTHKMINTTLVTIWKLITTQLSSAAWQFQSMLNN